MAIRLKDGDVMTCQRCGGVTMRRGPMQKYCEPCSHARDMDRKRLWAREHPLDPGRAVRHSAQAAARKEVAREAGLEINRAAKSGVAWDGTPGPDLIWAIRVALPFTYAASKNHIYTSRATGHVALRREAKDFRASVAASICAGLTLAGRRVAHNKVWIDILAQKPNHKGDAINLLDLVADGIKDALPVDDRWFCVRRVDWEIVKESPRLFIGIGQETEEDCNVCCYCGQIRPLDMFNKAKGRPLGVGIECKDCRRAGRVKARKEAQ